MFKITAVLFIFLFSLSSNATMCESAYQEKIKTLKNTIGIAGGISVLGGVTDIVAVKGVADKAGLALMLSGGSVVTAAAAELDFIHSGHIMIKEARIGSYNYLSKLVENAKRNLLLPRTVSIDQVADYINKLEQIGELCPSHFGPLPYDIILKKVYGRYTP